MFVNYNVRFFRNSEWKSRLQNSLVYQSDRSNCNKKCSITSLTASVV
jgi:hypothetical protein